MLVTKCAESIINKGLYVHLSKHKTMQKSNVQLAFSSMIISNRKIKKQFFNQIDKIIDWHKIEKEINKYYKKGLRADGRPSYNGLKLGYKWKLKDFMAVKEISLFFA